MKKVFVAVAILGAMGFVSSASAAVASHVFSWSGTVPAASTDSAWIIKTPQKDDIPAGILTFTTAGDKGVLTGSTDLAFNVFDYATPPTVGNAAASYTYQLSSLAINSAGLAAEQGADGYFEIQANGAALVKGQDVTVATGEATTLIVAPTAVATPSNQPDAGDDVNVQATIVVSAAS
ncbi:hypothetical protein [Aeromonas sp. 602200]|uniref:hypothetical protein n=1 Tax=Aeromonas sp. 602200 TaxID=2712040 RepID=UPI003BA2C56B